MQINGREEWPQKRDINRERRMVAAGRCEFDRDGMVVRGVGAASRRTM